jgi:hypothetical protein
MKKDKYLQIVPYDQAKRLKKLGFDWTNINSVQNWYYPEPDGNIIIFNTQFTDKSIPAPTVALALKWMRDKKGIDNAVNIEEKERMFGQRYYGCFIQKGIIYLTQNFSSHSKAESALLDKLLNFLE